MPFPQLVRLCSMCTAPVKTNLCVGTWIIGSPPLFPIHAYFLTKQRASIPIYHPDSATRGRKTMSNPHLHIRGYNPVGMLQPIYWWKFCVVHHEAKRLVMFGFSLIILSTFSQDRGLSSLTLPKYRRLLIY